VTLSFLTDENISPESAAHLETLGYPCRSLCREGPRQLSDREIVALAKREAAASYTVVDEAASSSLMTSTLRQAQGTASDKSTTSPKRVK